MSSWTYVTGVIHVESHINEDQLLSLYGLFSHDLVGSEGGANISFTYTSKKDGFDSSSREYFVEPYQRLSSMVFQGHLRNFDEDKMVKAVQGMEGYLRRLKESKVLKGASFLFECNHSDNYYQVSYALGRVRRHKGKVQG